MKRGTLIGIAVLAFSLLPAWAVNSASQQSRFIWVGTVLCFAFFGGIASLAAKASSHPVTPELGPYIRRYQPYVGAFSGLIFLLASLFSIAITYTEPGVGFAGWLGIFLSKVGAILFPVVAKYATAIEPPLAPDALFRAQTIVSTFLLATIPTAIVFAVYFFGMPDSERRELYAVNPKKRPSDVVVILIWLFAPLLAAAVFFGWGEFDDEPVTKTKECLMKAACYAQGDDLLIMAAAMMKAVVFYLFPVGALVIADANRILPRPDANT